MSALNNEIQRVKEMDVSRIAAAELLREMILKHEAKTESRIRDLERTRDKLKLRLSGDFSSRDQESKSTTAVLLNNECVVSDDKKEGKDPTSHAAELKKRLHLFDVCAKKKIEVLEREISTLKAALGII